MDAPASRFARALVGCPSWSDRWQENPGGRVPAARPPGLEGPRGQVLQGIAEGARQSRASGASPVAPGRPGEPCRPFQQLRSATISCVKGYDACVSETISRWNQVSFFRNLPTSRTICPAARFETPKAMCVQSSSTALSRSLSSPRADRGAISPSLRDQSARVGTGGLSVIRGNGGLSTLCPAISSYSRQTLFCLG